MSKATTKTMAKGSVVSRMIAEEITREFQEPVLEPMERPELLGLNPQARAFMIHHLSRVHAGKRLANAGATLRECKSQETLAFWGPYAVPYTGFGGAHYFKAPPLDKMELKERLNILGWKHRQAPAGYLAWAKKHGVTITAFEAACYQQEQAAYKAAQVEAPLPTVQFKESTIADIIAQVSNDIVCGKVLEALAVQVKAKLAEKN